MTATVPIATLQASIVFVILVVASLYASTPEDPIVPTLPDIDIDPPIDGGPGLGNNTSHPGDNLIPVVDAGGDVVTVNGQEARLRGIAIDPDGEVTLFEWDMDGDGEFDWADNNSGDALWTFYNPGNYTARFRVTDDQNGSASDTISVEVRRMPLNLAPISVAGEDLTVEQAEAVEFNMVGYDTDGSIAKYEWDYDGDGTFDQASSVIMITYHIYIEPGVYNATLRVTDDQDAFGTDNRTITVRERALNLLSTADAGPDKEVMVGQSTILTGIGTDSDGWIIEYRWDFDGDNEFDWTSTTTGIVEHTYDEPSEYTARLLVIDNNETAATDTVMVTVVPVPVNHEPTADAGPDNLQQVVQGEEMLFSGTGTDPDGIIVLYEWDFDGDDIWDWSNTNHGITSWTYGTIGQFDALLRVTDDEGATAQDVLRVKVTSDDPGDRFWPSDGKITVGALGTWSFDPNEIETVRPDIFAKDHFSLFDVLVHLDKQGEIDLEYHFDEALNTHVIDKINGIGNWWYWAYYHMGWQEANNFRMDHYPYKDKMTINVVREDASRIGRIHQVFRDEVKRLEANDGKVIIPKVTLRLRSRTLTFTDVEVTAHNLRNDTFQDGVITAIDVILSLTDQGEITSKLTWYETIGFAEILNYFVDGINNDIAHGTCGFVYEEGSEKLRYGNHIHIPSDYRVLNSPEYEEWFWICL